MNPSRFRPRYARGCARASAPVLLTFLLWVAVTHAQTFGPDSDSSVEEVRFRSTEPPTAADRHAELRVMSQLLQDALGHRDHQGPDYRMGIPVLMHAPSSTVQSLYLEGFGALFLARVDFPVVPDARAGTRPSPNSTPSSPWEAARQRLEGNAAGTGPAGESSPGTSPQRLDEILGRLIEALRQATNMITLANSDFVAVRVEGRGQDASVPIAPPTAGQTMSTTTGGGVMVSSVNGQTVTRTFSLGDRPPSVDPSTGRLIFAPPPLPREAPARSTLTLRVSSADLRALGAGKLTAEGFASRVESQRYQQ
ncbi:MAG: hypothetical protein IT580_16990 [Verrucomicrobiales bacterium]|nr:hypothetical protein [Verrucomicrobiales bacterium]